MLARPLRPCWILALVLGACFNPSTEETESDASTGTGTSTAGSTSTSTAGPTGPGDTSAGVTSTTTDSGVDTSATSVSSTSDGTASTTTGAMEGCDDFDGHIMYINIDGVTLTEGLVDNAPNDVTSQSSLAGTWGAYTNADIDQVFEIVVEHWAAYDVCVTLERPTALDYNMIVIQSDTYMDNPNNPGPCCTPDCDDMQANNVAVLVLADEAGLAPATKAVAISKFLARRLVGLESVSEQSDIMNNPIGSTLNGATFTDECVDKSFPSMCMTYVDCGPEQQRAHAYLIDTLGPA